MVTKTELVSTLLQHRNSPPQHAGRAYAPSNIALAKYWGKRDSELNLPMNSSLSISLQHKGAQASIQFADHQHTVSINHQPLDLTTEHGKKIRDFLTLFGEYFAVELEVNLPFAAGLASSACIFAALVLALDELHQWNLPPHELSILARLGSGSACRSIHPGFVEWKKGSRPDGMDCFSVRIEQEWPQFCIGLLILDPHIKKVSSREGMQRTRATSPLYSAWPSAANQATDALKEAIHAKDFETLGRLAEHNALSMHATMMSAWPPILYSNEKSIQQMKRVWALREDGLSLYFTQDAGPNIKLLFLEKNKKDIQEAFPSVEVIHPFQPPTIS